MTPTEIARLAAIVWNVRPEWHQMSLHTFISRNLATKPYHLAVVAFIACAVDPDTKTPARVLENGPWWRAAAIAFGYEPATPTPEGVSGMSCARCGQFVPASERPVHGDNCAPKAQDQAAARKAAFAAASITTTEEDQ